VQFLILEEHLLKLFFAPYLFVELHLRQCSRLQPKILILLSFLDLPQVILPHLLLSLSAHLLLDLLILQSPQSLQPSFFGPLPQLLLAQLPLLSHLLDLLFDFPGFVDC
jgi:hypothetical protein